MATMITIIVHTVNVEHSAQYIILIARFTQCPRCAKNTIIQGCQFSDLNLISDFFENKGKWHKIDYIESKREKDLHSIQGQA